MCFLAELKNNQLLIPSSKNYFGAFKVAKLMVDDGCSTMLIVLDSLQNIDDIFVSFPPVDHFYKADFGYGTGGKTLTFEVTNKAKNVLIPLHFCRDLLPDAPQLYVDIIRFAINTAAEVQYLLSEHSSKMGPLTIRFLEKYKDQMSPDKTYKLAYSLIGFKILEKVGVVRSSTIQYYFNTTLCTMINFALVDSHDSEVSQHLAFKTSPTELRRIAEECKREAAVRKGFADLNETILCLWSDELAQNNKKTEHTFIFEEDVNEESKLLAYFFGSRKN